MAGTPDVRAEAPGFGTDGEDRGDPPLSRDTCGARMIHAELADAHGIGVGSKRVARLIC